MKKGILFLVLLCITTVILGCAKPSDSTLSKMDNNLLEDNTIKTPEITEPAKPIEGAAEDAAKENETDSEDTVVSDALLSELYLPVAATDYVSEEMLQNAILNEGNLARLAAVMRKAKNGEKVTVAVMGGSITQGSSAAYGNAYANHFEKWWLEAFPEAELEFINAGIGATNSYLGVHRADRDLLAYHPDVVVLEFSVNDSDSMFYQESYEDLIRKILKEENNPAIIQLFMTMEDGTSAQAIHGHLGFWYELPRISYREAVLKEIEKGTFTWKDISPDNIHPNDKGHAIVGELLWAYLNKVYAKLDTITEEVEPFTKAPFLQETYIDATILDSSNLEPVSLGSFTKEKVYSQFPNNWRTSSGSDAIVFETEAKNIGIMFYKTVNGKSGQFDVYVDGEFVRTLNGDFTGGWGNYAETIEVYRSTDKKMHRIEIKKSEASTGDEFALLALLIS